MTEIRPAVEDDVGAIVGVLADPGVMEWWGTTTAEDVREELSDSFVVLVGDETAGWLQYHEETEPEWRFVSFDIAVADRFQGQGDGPAALRLAIEHFVALGHHRFTIDPALDNGRAVRAYAAVGFQPVGVLRRYEILPGGGYRDGLLMDLLADELSA
ncbi:MAG: GNAT family N-acetyltransferase [Solirubrobacteraceae bacterium]